MKYIRQEGDTRMKTVYVLVKYVTVNFLLKYYGIIGVFSTKKKAEEYRQTKPDGGRLRDYKILEYFLR